MSTNSINNNLLRDSYWESVTPGRLYKVGRIGAGLKMGRTRLATGKNGKKGRSRRRLRHRAESRRHVQGTISKGV